SSGLVSRRYPCAARHVHKDVWPPALDNDSRSINGWPCSDCLTRAASAGLSRGLHRMRCGDGVGLVDWLYAYTAAAQYFSNLPLLETPRPQFEVLANVQWLAIVGTPGSYTEMGSRFDSVIKHLSGGDLPLRLEGMKQRYVQNLNPRDPGPDR